MKGTTRASMRMREKFHRHLGAQKTFAIVEDLGRHYDFVDSPFLWIPHSPLIERQSLQLLEEMQLRTACRVLCEMISRGEIAVAPKPVSRKPRATEPVWPEDDMVKDRLKRLLGRPVSGLSADTRSNSRSKASSKYDSGISMGSPKSPDVANPVEGVLDSITEFSSKGVVTIARSQQEDSDPNLGCRDPVAGLLTATNLSRLNTMISPDTSDNAPVVIQDEIPSVMEDALRGLDSEFSLKQLTSPALARTASFSRPSGSLKSAREREGSPKVFDRQEVAPTSRPRTQQTRRDDIPRDYSWKTSETLNRPRSSHQDSVAVIIGTDGMEHVMTVSEQKERYLDLRSAVMEKMQTGTIAQNSDKTASVTMPSDQPVSQLSVPPKDTPSTPLQDGKSTFAHRKPVVDKTSTTSAENVSLRKKPSLLRKLSIIGSNKRKTSNLHNSSNMTGLTRVAEAS